MSHQNAFTTLTHGAGIAVGFGASLVVGFGAGITMGFSAGLTAGYGLGGSNNVADTVLEKLGYDWVDVIYMFWDPEKQAKEAAAAAAVAGGVTTAAVASTTISESSKPASDAPRQRAARTAKSASVSKPVIAQVAPIAPVAPAPAVVSKPKTTSMSAIFRKRLSTGKAAPSTAPVQQRKAA